MLLRGSYPEGGSCRLTLFLVDMLFHVCCSRCPGWNVVPRIHLSVDMLFKMSKLTVDMLLKMSKLAVDMLLKMSKLAVDILFKMSKLTVDMSRCPSWHVVQAMVLTTERLLSKWRQLRTQAPTLEFRCIVKDCGGDESPDSHLRLSLTELLLVAIEVTSNHLLDCASYLWEKISHILY